MQNVAPPASLMPVWHVSIIVSDGLTCWCNLMPGELPYTHPENRPKKWDLTTLMSSQHNVTVQKSTVLPVQVKVHKGWSPTFHTLMPQHHLKSTIPLLHADTHGPSVFPHFGFILMFNYHNSNLDVWTNEQQFTPSDATDVQHPTLLQLTCHFRMKNNRRSPKKSHTDCKCSLIKKNRFPHFHFFPSICRFSCPRSSVKSILKQEEWLLPKTAGWPTAEESLLLENFSAVIVDKDQSQINIVF